MSSNNEQKLRDYVDTLDLQQLETLEKIVAERKATLDSENMHRTTSNRPLSYSELEDRRRQNAEIDNEQEMNACGW